MTAQELSVQLEVSERTIYRDLDALSIAGVPVFAERGPGGGCALLDSYRTNLTGLAEDELRALFMLSVPSPLHDLGMSKPLEAAQRKLAAAISSARQTEIDRVRQRIYLDPKTWFQTPEAVPHLETIQEAVWQDKRVRITYRRSDGEWVKRLVDPLGLVAKAHTWYLVGMTIHGRQVYRVSRIRDAAMTDTHFKRPTDFDLAKAWHQWTASLESNQPQYSVQIRVAAAFISTLSQTLGDAVQPAIEQAKTEEDGWLVLTLNFDSIEEARTTMLGFGDAVEVVSPLALRQSIVEYATRILTFYTLA